MRDTCAVINAPCSFGRVCSSDSSFCPRFVEESKRRSKLKKIIEDFISQLPSNISAGRAHVKTSYAKALSCQLNATLQLPSFSLFHYSKIDCPGREAFLCLVISLIQKQQRKCLTPFLKLGAVQSLLTLLYSKLSALHKSNGIGSLYGSLKTRLLLNLDCFLKGASSSGRLALTVLNKSLLSFTSFAYGRDVKQNTVLCFISKNTSFQLVTYLAAAEGGF